MATKKATTPKAKRPAAKKSTARQSTSTRKSDKPVIVEEEIVEVVETGVQPAAATAEIDDAPAPKMTFKEKLVALRPGALIAELVGTFVLAGLVMSIGSQGTLGAVGIAIGLAILVMVLGVVSGAHLNPAITIAQYVNRKIDGVKAVAYIIMQVAGAVLVFFVLNSAMTLNYNNTVQASLEKAANVSSADIDKAGGLSKFLSTNYNMSVDDAAGQLGLNASTLKPTHAATLTDGQQWITFFLEMLGAAIFGLGVGYAVFKKNKSAIETGLAVGVALFAGLMIGGSTVILNPAVAAAIGGYTWSNALFGAGAMTFWWPVFIYIGASVVGMTAGFTVYRLVLKDALAKR